MSQPSGWYDDPEQQGMLRYWDGGGWTHHRQPKPAAQQASAQLASPYQASPYQGYNQYQGQQYAGQQHPGQPYRGGPMQPQRKRSGASVIVMVLVVGLVIMGGLVWQVARAVGQLTTDPGPSSSASSTPAVPVYYMNERPGYAEMRAYVEGVHEKYSTALADGSIVKYVPDTDEGFNYAQAFVYILTDYKVALIWMGGPSTDPDELDALIQGHRDKVSHIEELFLAGEDLGFSVTITSADGTVFESEGVAPELVYDDPEEFAQNFRPRPDADGRYVGAMAELAAAFDMEVTYNWAPGVDGCAEPEGDVTRFVAWFCPVTPNLVWISPLATSYPDNLSTEFMVDTVRHEIAHRRIFDLCGTTRPPIAGTLVEAVTNSYGVLYLGSNPEMDNGQSDEYQMSDESHRIAELIYNGTCA